MKSIIKHDRVRLEHDVRPFAAPAAQPSAALPHRGRRTARLVELDGRVRAVEVTCDCGEVTLVELEYEEEA